MQKKCWCKHALQSQWGESLGFILFNLLRFDMQAPGWLLLERSLASGAALRPAKTTDLEGLEGHPCLPTCLEAITTTLETSSASPPPLCFPKLEKWPTTI